MSEYITPWGLFNTRPNSDEELTEKKVIEARISGIEIGLSSLPEIDQDNFKQKNKDKIEKIMNELKKEYHHLSKNNLNKLKELSEKQVMFDYLKTQNSLK